MRKNQLLVERLNVGSFRVNTYIVACPETLDGIIIDPGGEDDRIIDVIAEKNITPRYIINTHGHRDHVHSNVSMSRYYQISLCMHVDDKLFFQKQTAFQDDDVKKAYDIDVELHHDDVLTVGTLDIKVLHTPGHTPGSACLSIDNCLFSGDTLFVGNAGRTDLPGGHFKTLIHSIQTRLVPLPPDTILYPGHDYGVTPLSTMGREIKENIYITDFMDG